jgi:hypothetical protein
MALANQDHPAELVMAENVPDLVQRDGIGAVRSDWPYPNLPQLIAGGCLPSEVDIDPARLAKLNDVGTHLPGGHLSLRLRRCRFFFVCRIALSASAHSVLSRVLL